MWSEIVEVLNPYEAVVMDDTKEKVSIRTIKDKIEFYRYWIKYGKNYESSVKKKVRRRR